MNLQELQEFIVKLGVDMTELLQKPEMSKDEELRFEKMDSDRDKLMKQRDRIIKHDDIEKRLNDTEGRRSTALEPSTESRTTNRINRPSYTPGEYLEGLRSWFLAGSDVERTPEMRAAAEKVGFHLDHKMCTIRLPRFALRGQSIGSSYQIRSEDFRDWETRAQGVATGGAGGFTVPDETMRALEVAILTFGGMRQVATILRTDTGAVLPFPTVNDTTQTGALLAENTQVANQDVTFAQMVLDAFKYSSKQVLCSVELLQDNAVNFASFIGDALGTRLGRITNTHFTTGTGSAQPNGIVTASTVGKTGATGQTTTIIYDDFVDLEHSVDPAYRVGARWMFHDLTLAKIKKIKIPQFSGDTQGQPLWQAGMAIGSPDTILGYPYTINQDVATMAANAKSVLFGSLNKYMVREVRDITLLRLDERFADFHQVAFLAFLRTDGDLLNAGTNPVKHYANSAT